MPFTDTLTSVSGRNSRASNVSGATGASRSLRSPHAATSGSDTLANAGVLSMLKTSTDTGDIGALSFNSSRLPGVPARGLRTKQHNHNSKASTSTHHHYAPSATSRVSSQTREWENASNGRQGSFTSMQTMPSNISEPQGVHGYHVRGPPMPGAHSRAHRDSRSHSLTSVQLPRLHSEHSLKSQDHDNRRYAGQPQMSELRPPYAYPTRLKRPGYRSPSPALSDSYAQIPPVPVLPAHMARSPVHGLPGQPYPAYSPVDYAQEHSMYAGHTMSPRSPTFPHGPQYAYHSHPASPPIYQPTQRYPTHLPFPQAYGPQRPRPVPAYHPQAQQQQMPLPPRQNLVPVAHQMFHNAARLARQLPQRADTPMMEMGIPSSDPPSSGDTAPTASSPPTPHDWTSLQVGINPAYIDPSLTDLPESASDPVIPARYFDYIDGLERVLDESDVGSHHPSVPPTGFVQRVKAMLESKAVAESNDRREEENTELVKMGTHEMVLQNHDRRITIIEEFQAPAELPASPVKIAELEATVPTKASVSHLTRELVKAELAPTDTIDATATDNTDEKVERRDYRPAISPFEEETIQSTDLPSSPPDVPRRQVSIDSSPRSSAAEDSRVLHEDFVVRFSMPSDDTTHFGETETESKDRLILDADTITAQHQVMKESAIRLLSTREPISPMSPGDFVHQYSEVSPLQTQIAGLDSTMQALRGKEDRKLETGQPPATPRTPRTHSKSVQIPATAETPSHANPNRLSLPVDFTQLGNTTVDSTEAMTDVAVRFSIPTLSLAAQLGKPQIVHISSSSPASKEEVQHTGKHVARKPEPSVSAPPSRQSSIERQADNMTVPSGNHVSLDRKHSAEGKGKRTTAIDKTPSSHRHIKSSGSHHRQQSTGAKAVLGREAFSDHYRESSNISKGTASRDLVVAREQMQRDENFDIRIPSTAILKNKYLGPHLSDLREESIEEISLRDSRRSSELVRGSQFQLPARIAAVKAMQERKQQEQEERARLREAGLQPHEQAGRPLADLRDLPSLNFSRTDLIDQLNEALNVRSMKSVEIMRRRDLQPIYCPSPQRPQSTEPLRERYVSFFDRPEDLFQIAGPEEDEADLEQAESTSATESVERPLSVDGHYLAMASQVNRLSIPSVAGLSERLSELLPSLKHLHFGRILGTDGDIAQTIEEIHNLGNDRPRPDTVLTNRTSAGFRTLAERAEEIVRNGTHDSLIPGSLRLHKDLPYIPASADKTSALLHDSKASYLSTSASAPSELGKQPSRPSSALVRYRPPTSQEECRQMLPPEMNPISRASKRSMVTSALSSRPWNLDENYP